MSENELRSAYTRLQQNFARAQGGAKLTQALVAQQISGGVELVLGVQRDPEVGPVLMFGSGGVLLELSKDVSCGAVPENPLWPSTSYHVCRFNNPGAVVVTQGGRTTIFEPGVGRPATVTVRDGKASCVVAGWFSY